jgi:hypothetical protein
VNIILMNLVPLNEKSQDKLWKIGSASGS